MTIQVFAYSARYFQGRCLFAYNANDGLHPYWESGQSFYNCISARNDNRGCRHDGYREYGAFAYNYLHRNYYGMSQATEYEPNEGFHHCIIDTTNHYAMQSNGADNFKQMVFMHGILKVLDMDCTVNNGKCYILGL